MGVKTFDYKHNSSTKHVNFAK